MTRLTTAQGRLAGRDSDGCQLYLGVPYAAAPVADLRFRAPEPAKPWDGELDATRFGASAWQPPPAPGGVLPRGKMRMDEDCLHLNVCTPAADDKARPVLVWIHGGSYMRGSGDAYDGRSFARLGDVVVVTINYRLGPFGFLDLGHLDPSRAGSHNNGIRDQIQALLWVRDNIADFGGDPDRVTICGESAGAGCVTALLASPEADGLYQAAISQSAPASFGPASPGLAEAFTGVLGDDDPFTVAPERIIDAHNQLTDVAQKAGEGKVALFGNGGKGYRPVVDGRTVTARPADAVAAQGPSAVPLLIGTNSHEGTLFGMGLPKTVTDDDLHGAVAEHSDDPARVVAAFRHEHSDHDNRRLAVEMLTDTMFRTPSLRVADAQADAGGSVHVYRFSWESQGFGGAFGATHALDIPFVWNADMNVWKALLGEGSPQPPDLASQMHHAWIAFTRTADPNHDGIDTWPRYDTDRRPTMDFGDTTRVLDDPAGGTRASWG